MTSWSSAVVAALPDWASEHAVVLAAAQAFPYLLSLSMRLLWALSFHGQGKVWTGEKQLRGLSADDAFVSNAFPCSSKQHTANTDFPQNQRKSQSAAWWYMNTLLSPCPSALRLHVCQAARRRVYPELITFELGIKCESVRQASQGTVSLQRGHSAASHVLGDWMRMKEQHA